MKVCLLDPRIFLRQKDDPGPFVAYDRMAECAKKSAVSHHVLVDSPFEADLVILGLTGTQYGPHFERIRFHPLIRKIRDKLVVYSPNDNQLPTLRGLYPAISRKWVERNWSHPFHYLFQDILQLKIEERELLEKDILCSFVGAGINHPVRGEILKLPARAGFHLFDSSHNRNDPWWWVEENRAELERNFRDVLVRSQFVLCPRGVSASTIRLFEAMEAAAVPVVVSDDCQLPAGPNWESFCIFVKESEVATIPERVEAWKDTAREKGMAARAAWKKYFSEEASFDYLVSSAGNLLKQPSPWPPQLLYEEFFGAGNFRAKLRYLKQRFQGTLSA